MPPDDTNNIAMSGGQIVNQPSFFDIRYPLASVNIHNGNLLVASTMADYFGFKLITTSAGATIRVYDALTASGKLLDIHVMTANSSFRTEGYTPIRARIGIYCSITGTGCEGVIIFAPKG